jgi:hypothetical protein
MTGFAFLNYEFENVFALGIFPGIEVKAVIIVL